MPLNDFPGIRTVSIITFCIINQELSGRCTNKELFIFMKDYFDDIENKKVYGKSFAPVITSYMF